MQRAPIASLPLLASVLLGACSTVGPAVQDRFARAGLDDPGGPYSTIQGMIGFLDTEGTDIEIEDPGEAFADDDGQSMPSIGVAVQNPSLGSEWAQVGLELGGTLSWDSDTRAVSTGNGTLIVLGDTDVFSVDLFVGAYVSVDVFERWRVYGGAGPLLQYTAVDLEYTDDMAQLRELESDGFGVGVYGRVGIERQFRDMTLGLGVRVIDSEPNMDDGLGDVDFQGLQVMVTATRGL
jgi:hypothetical protein